MDGGDAGVEGGKVMGLTMGRSERPVEETNGGRDWLPVVLWLGVWWPAMSGAAYSWSHGGYYDYGWFVPPVAAWLLIRRWREWTGEVRPLGKRWWYLAAAWVPWVLLLRVLGQADPQWRLPVGLLGFTAVVAGHAVMAAAVGWRASLSYWKITLLWLSALPWPSMVETGIVHQLTQMVVGAAAEVFQMVGKPVEVLGDLLVLHGVTVEVTDGCSGVRSFQSFLMATWFFAELQRLDGWRTAWLFGWGVGIGLVVNLGRTLALAQIRFGMGEQAFDKAHDLLGLLAFVVSGVLFFVISGCLGKVRRRLVVRRNSVSTS